MANVEVYASFPNKGLASPFFDSAGLLHVVAERTGEVLQIDSQKSVTMVCNTGGQPRGAAFGCDGNLYMSDPAHAALITYIEGRPQVVVRQYEDKTLKGPHSLIVDSKGVLYFTDSGPFGETGLFNPKGSLFCITHDSQRNTELLRPLALGAMAYPAGLALSPDEQSIYVAEQMANRLLRFTQHPPGVYHGSSFYQFSGSVGPSDVVVGHEGNIRVAHFEFADASAPQPGRVTVLSPDGVLLRVISVPAPQLTGIIFSPDKSSLYVTESSHDCIYRIRL